MNDRRKSMRRAADPCLGFYVLPPSPVRPIDPVSNDPPPIEVTRPDDSSPYKYTVERPDVTVDAFLRQSALTRSKTYAGKKSRRRRINRHGRSRNETETADETEVSHSRPRRPTLVRQASKPLKKRILSAAVLSHGDPSEWLLQDDSVPQTRIPLSFVESQPPRELVQTKQRTWSLVDPRKALPAHSNSFSTRSKAPTGSTPKRNTLSGWQKTYGRIYLDGSVITKRKANSKASKIKQVPSKCLPLSFVPLDEAERGYLLMRLPPKLVAENPKPRVTIAEVTKSGRIPLHFASSSPPQTDCFAPGTSYTELLQPSCPSLVLTTHPDIANHSGDGPMSPAAIPPPISTCDIATSLPSAHASPQAVRSTLKPLASFLDQFLQTARSETQLERTKKKAPRKPLPNSNRVNPQQPISALKSFIQSTVRQTSARHPSDHHRSSARLTYTPDVSSFDFPPPMSPQFRVPSPDINCVLQPTPYQVVLPSTPPTSRQPVAGTSGGIVHDITLDSSINLFYLNTRD
ncbi:hypothetical protein DFH07DRAFT_481776 [Mycena maculata]|uniref:Uncharacterized protein n=1 Tax=Mycena maculata TaxID=230809 RepID=A0AAD7J676_9AGAR|nr:hypothetical protein DFH07DRAFT_481776 [Mycena maculata]